MKGLFFFMCFSCLVISCIAQDLQLPKKNNPTAIKLEIQEVQRMIQEIERLIKLTDKKEDDLNKLRNLIFGYRKRVENLENLRVEALREIDSLKKNEKLNQARIKELVDLNNLMSTNLKLLEQKNEELKKENEILREENDQLKSHLLYAAQQSFENGVKIFGKSKNEKNRYESDVYDDHLTFDQMSFLCIKVEFLVSTYILSHKIESIKFEVYKVSSKTGYTITVDLKNVSNSSGFIAYSSKFPGEIEFDKAALSKLKGRTYIEHEKNINCPFDYKYTLQVKEK